ncbi:DUF4040 domain-containing protein [bacterium]|nr:DUF4040 domain-containing protein [bacterium]
MMLEHVGILLLLVATAFAAARLRKTMMVAILFGIFSLLVATMYLLLEAPDVAITEAAVGAGISTLVIIATLLHTGKHDDRPHKGHFLVLGMVACLGLALMLVMHQLPPIGEADTPVNRLTDANGDLTANGHYQASTQRDIGVPNMVTAVLASYRGYDTMGETAVVFTALIAVLLILWPGIRHLFGGTPKGDGHA